ncbi:MAG: peptidoglycan-binding domain-containing protein [Caulobacteraceae bacterium]
MKLRPSTAALLTAALTALAAAPASAFDKGHGGGILADLPANAPPGECYAKVRYEAEPVGPPPVALGAQWVQTPGPPGSPGPIWCLVPTGPQAVQAPPALRFGWIRVLCDGDITEDRVRHLQHRLHDHGVYRGEFNGAYDSGTAAAVGEFQQRSHLAHGGYLSLDTVDALESPPEAYRPAPPPPPPSIRPHGDYARAAPPPEPPPERRFHDHGASGGHGAYGESCYSESHSSQSYSAPGYYQQAPYPPQAYSQGYAQGVYSQGSYPQGGYGPPPGYAPPAGYGQSWTPPYASTGSAIQNGYLVWAGKTRF